jgi:hypothetical protein
MIDSHSIFNPCTDGKSLPELEADTLTCSSQQQIAQINPFNSHADDSLPYLLS